MGEDEEACELHFEGHQLGCLLDGWRVCYCLNCDWEYVDKILKHAYNNANDRYFCLQPLQDLKLAWEPPWIETWRPNRERQ